jgi:hypothetical protein
MFETSFNETENYSEILVEIAWLRNCGDLRIKLKNNYLTIVCVFEFKGFHNEGGGVGGIALKICHGPRTTLIRPCLHGRILRGGVSR